jgi:hypothetical protein
LWRGLNQPWLALDPLAGLAELYLAQNKLPQAAACIEPILNRLPPEQNSGGMYHSLAGVDDPARIFRAGYAVLQANGDPRAEMVLAQGGQFLHAQAAAIKDERLRRTFLERAIIDPARLLWPVG